MKRSVLTFAVSVALAGATATQAGALPAFSTNPKHGPVIGSNTSKVVGVTTGRHATFDRVVLRFSGGRPRWTTRFVQTPLRDPSGLPIAVEGKSYLEIVLFPTRALSIPYPWKTTPRRPTLRQVRTSGDFEAVVTLVAGLRYRAPYRVFTLTRPYRIVIDVAH